MWRACIVYLDPTTTVGRMPNFVAESPSSCRSQDACAGPAPSPAPSTSPSPSPHEPRERRTPPLPSFCFSSIRIRSSSSALAFAAIFTAMVTGDSKFECNTLVPGDSDSGYTGCGCGTVSDGVGGRAAL